MTFNPKRIRQRHSHKLLIESLEKMPPPFQGEEMACIFCGSVVRSNPNQSFGWRCLELNSKDRHYICAGCLPDAREPTRTWIDFYVRAVKRIVEITPDYKPAKSLLLWRETGGVVTNAHLN